MDSIPDIARFLVGATLTHRALKHFSSLKTKKNYKNDQKFNSVTINGEQNAPMIGEFPQLQFEEDDIENL